MIYKKDANFPYPLLTNTSSSYQGCNFVLDVSLEENSENYRFEINYEMDSKFILELLQSKHAQLVLVIQSKDNKFFNLKLGERYIEISKSRISLSKRTNIQLLIQAKEEISFVKNEDLSPFYDALKDEIVVPKHSILGFSNCVIFEGSNNKPLELFEKRVNPNIKSDIKIELGSETIVIQYKKEELQFSDFPMSNTLNNHYIYMGLQKALYRFIVTHSEDGESVDLEQLDHPEDGLDFKLYTLMKKKMVQELNVENMDEVICLISDKILDKHANAIKGLYQNEN
ncbi:hypothetical protein PBV87_21405 [Niameybacter massiliensis]|uniref:Uncharacterized protein n=1 Tax=Holtiella tumoricola TaxID=3018743 RepID=A0AA42DRZ4_9FIRM|nr:hypothetical protein [Holtiella tumoricola]MDA3734035.1 hypothetical protein [Holtiella tumoricola]